MSFSVPFQNFEAGPGELGAEGRDKQILPLTSGQDGGQGGW